jgi:hypothetical protein
MRGSLGERAANASGDAARGSQRLDQLAGQIERKVPKARRATQEARGRASSAALIINRCLRLTGRSAVRWAADDLLIGERR